MNKNYEFSGWMMTCFGLFKVISFIGIFVYFDIPFSAFEDLDTTTALLVIITAITTLLAIFCGIGLIKGHQNIHWLALPVALLVMFEFPVGTIVGGMYLLERRKTPIK